MQGVLPDRGQWLTAGGLMTEAEERAGEYRDKAETLRDLARQTRSPDCGRELLALAEAFEKLAERVGVWDYAAVSISSATEEQLMRSELGRSSP